MYEFESSMAIWQNENRDSIGPRPLCLCSIGTVQDQYTVYSKKYRYRTGPVYNIQYRTNFILNEPRALTHDPGALHH